MYMVEDHIIPFPREYHVAAGLLGEQGAESLHAHMNRLEDNYSSVVQGSKRLEYIFREYALEVAPQLQQLKPPPHKKAKKRELVIIFVSS